MTAPGLSTDCNGEHLTKPQESSSHLHGQHRPPVPRAADNQPSSTTSPSASFTSRSRPINQQFISLIANVGSTVLDAEMREMETSREPLAQSYYFRKEIPTRFRDTEVTSSNPRHRMERHSGQADMLQSLPALQRPPRIQPPRRKHRAAMSDPMTSSQILERPSAKVQLDGSVSHKSGAAAAKAAEQKVGKLDARQHVEAGEGPEDLVTADGSALGPDTGLDLADMLVKIFGFQEREEVLADYPCYLMQSSLLQGSLYILRSHVCFYAYLPKRSSTAIKSGFLWKRGRQNPKYNRYWFILKGDVLSYYKDASQLYFPRGTIDLGLAKTAQLVSSPLTPDGHAALTISTAQETMSFRAESETSATEWVAQISGAIYKAQNEGDNIKILLSAQNVVDIDENPVLEAANTIRIRAIDNDETYAVEEYFFTFFGNGQDALKDLRTVLNQHTKAVKDDRSILARVRESLYLNNSEQAASPSQPGDELLIDASPRQSSRKGAQREFEVSQTQQATAYPLPSTTMAPVSDIPAGQPQFVKRPSLQPSASFSKLQDVIKAGTTPLQTASSLAMRVRAQSKRMGNLLANESLGYYEKAYSMWAGKKMHYDETEGQSPQFPARDGEQERKHGDRFRQHFSLPPTEKLLATYYTYLSRLVPVYGKIYVGNSRICFRSLLPGSRTKMILPMKDIENVVPEKGFRFGYSGLVIGVRGHEEIFFEFRHADVRDDCTVTLLGIVETARVLEESRLLTEEEVEAMKAAKAEHDLLEKARRASNSNDPDNMPIVFEDTNGSSPRSKPPSALNIVCLTIGSRGDVQPFIALCKALQAEGHNTTIATHTEFAEWITGHNINFKPVAGNPAEIMKLCVENDMFTVNFLREAHKKFRGFIDELLETAYDACQGADLLIESPSAMAGIHIAEKLEIPYFRAFTMPWTRTRALPHAFAVPTNKLGGNYNMMTYVMFDTLFWQAIAGQINRWRKKCLGLGSTSLDKMQADKVPFLYNFSPSVVIPPLDFNHWVHITGYWFLDEGKGYQPDPSLADFIKKAKQDGKKLVYVGFGSVVVDDPAEMTRSIVAAVVQADVRCILSKGWSDRLDKAGTTTTEESELPTSIHRIRGAPHDWLFRQVDAAAHHGGAGTTGASIRAGIPTIVKPFFGDQYFFGGRIEDLGIGICLREITETGLAAALRRATSDEKMVGRASRLGEKIRGENGVHTAIQAIYKELNYAQSLIKKQGTVEEVYDGSEESWELVGNESDDGGEGQRLVAAAPADGMDFQPSLAQRSGPERTSDGAQEEEQDSDNDVGRAFS